MTTKDDATVVPYHFDLARFERKAAAYDRAINVLIRECHYALVHIDEMLREGSGYESIAKQPRMAWNIGLPWGYTFRTIFAQSHQMRYRLSWGSNDRLVLLTTLNSQNVLVPLYDLWPLVTLTEDLRDGYLDEVTSYALADAQARIDILGSGRPDAKTEDEIFSPFGQGRDPVEPVIAYRHASLN